MTGAAPDVPKVRLDQRATMHAIEFAAFTESTTGACGPAWPTTPGGVLSGADGWPCILHFAPLRWLLIDPTEEWHALVEAGVQAGRGTIVDVSGKWEMMTLGGPSAARVLAHSIDVESVTRHRGCAAVMLFGCPAILAADATQFRLCVQRSYAADFVAAVLRLGQAVADAAPSIRW